VAVRRNEKRITPLTAAHIKDAGIHVVVVVKEINEALGRGSPSVFGVVA
jgi:hypothetical protein